MITDVYYAYDDTDVLDGVSLDVRPGEHLAVVGASGAGKTTLGRLIAGIDRPRAGSVTVGGAVIADLEPEQLREHVLLVTQEHHVFSDPLRDNLTIAAPQATDDELRSALLVVGADWVDELPDGLDTDLATHQLTGAQAQHVALARVLLANPTPSSSTKQPLFWTPARHGTPNVRWPPPSTDGPSSPLPTASTPPARPTASP